MKFKLKPHLIALIIIFFMVFLFSILSTLNSPSKSLSIKINLDFALKGKVTKVIDGDTFYFKPTFGKQKKVRMLGIDAPESVSSKTATNSDFGKKVSNYLNKKLLNKKVSLVLDKNIYDAYDRILAYVFINNNDFNNHLLLIGYAKAYFVGSNIKFKSKYLNTEKIARKNGSGMWGLFTFRTNPKNFKYVGSTKGKKYHLITCSYSKNISVENRIYLKSIEACKIYKFSACKKCES